MTSARNPTRSHAKNWLNLLSILSKKSKPVDFHDTSTHHPEITYHFIKGEIKVVKQVFEGVGLSSASPNWNILWCTGVPKHAIFHSLSDSQWVNHMPFVHELTRKDKLCFNVQAMIGEFGKRDFQVMPPTYVLPEDFPDFYEHYQSQKSAKWIVKPPASSQGRGIYLLKSIESLNINKSCVISQYIDKPLLINQLKFDLRLYVLVTSFDPLRIYVHQEGLARFASEKYAANKNRFSHLTNYSVNKKNKNFINNQDPEEDDVGHKWSLKALLKFLETHQINTKQILESIMDLVIKTIIASEEPIVESMRKHHIGLSQCFELFGFDILIDQNLRPWVIEVNLSPSMGIESPLDLQIKTTVIRDTFNLVGIRKSSNAIRTRLSFKPNGLIGRTRNQRKPLSFREKLRDTLEEFQRRGGFERVYPSQHSDVYDDFLAFIGPNQKLFEALFPAANENLSLSHKVVLTGDDVLIEYISRLWYALNGIDESSLKSEWRRSLERFVNHHVWDRDPIENRLSSQMEARLIEMEERRTLLNGGKERGDSVKRIVSKFSASELEGMIQTSCKQSAAQIVSCLFQSGGRGLLSQIVRWIREDGLEVHDF